MISSNPGDVTTLAGSMRTTGFAGALVAGELVIVALALTTLVAKAFSAEFVFSASLAQLARIVAAAIRIEHWNRIEGRYFITGSVHFTHGPCNLNVAGNTYIANPYDRPIGIPNHALSLQ
jgi:hypothetical protein